MSSYYHKSPKIWTKYPLDIRFIDWISYDVIRDMYGTSYVWY